MDDEYRLLPIPDGMLRELAVCVADGLDTDTVNRRQDSEHDEEGEKYIGGWRWNELHMPWENDPELAMDDEVRDTLARPAFFRTYRITTGIDRQARSIAVQPDSPCPFCRERFRNPAALKIHMEDRHGAAVEQIELLIKDNSDKCVYCGMPFTDWHERLKHQRDCR